ncbi:MAG: RNA pseudouridine synthase [Verrucomicrobia bacterium]|nr:MAG: RNA pseudouridine synthase [Verrucomicrobiota bacterium]
MNKIGERSGEKLDLNIEQDPFGEDAPLVCLEELKSWIVYEDSHLLVINKPGWLVCHPSKNGPLSSLVGACREYTGLESLHLVSRLDRETSGVVLLAKDKKMARICQMSMEFRLVKKIYNVLLIGELNKEIYVDQPLAKDIKSSVHAKQCVRQDRTSQEAQTTFRPLYSQNGYTFCEVELHTGRKHQIRAHAEWLGFPIVGDKIYGGNEELFLEFIEKGWTEKMSNQLIMKRQAIHAARLEFLHPEFKESFSAPLPEDMDQFCNGFMKLKISSVSI